MSSSEQAEGPRPTSPLLAAIAELRELIPRLFEEQKVLLQSRDPEPAAIPSIVPVVQAPAPVSMPTLPRPTVAPTAPEPTSLVRKPLAPAPARVPEPPTPSDSPPPSPIEPGSPSGPGARPDDPRQRLDALARLLDKRLKPSPPAPGRTGDT